MNPKKNRSRAWIAFKGLVLPKRKEFEFYFSPHTQVVETPKTVTINGHKINYAISVKNKPLGKEPASQRVITIKFVTDSYRYQSQPETVKQQLCDRFRYHGGCYFVKKFLSLRKSKRLLKIF